MSVAVLSLLVTAGVLVAPVTPAALAVRQAAEECVEPGADHQPVPWAQQWLAPERAWPFAAGSGVTVAVLSTGVDGDHPQLDGRVAAGFDAVAGDGPADSDCLGTGTQVAGLIAAGPVPDTGFAGLAPEATVLPVRVVDPAAPDRPVDPAVLAAGVRGAVESGAHVINVPVAVYDDHDGLRAAVDDAVSAGVVLVAAAGAVDAAPEREPDAGEGDADPVPYPAAYEGVIGVGAIGPDGGRWEDSPAGDFVDLVAPGTGMVTAQSGGGMVVDASGTGLASGVVAGAAVLTRERWPDLTPAEVGHRLAMTATPGPGWGVVSPYAAVTDSLAGASREARPALDPPGGDPRPGGAWARTVAVAGAAVAALLAVAVSLAAVALPRGRRRRWRSRIAPSPPPPVEEPGPPLMLFDERPR